MGLYVGLDVSQKQTWIAVARKLAIILHKMWINGQDFEWKSVPKEELEAAQAS